MTECDTVEMPIWACPVCLQSNDAEDNDIVPCLLVGCGSAKHAFCLDCCIEMYKKHAEEMVCPNCRNVAQQGNRFFFPIPLLVNEKKNPKAAVKLADWEAAHRHVLSTPKPSKTLHGYIITIIVSLLVASLICFCITIASCFGIFIMKTIISLIFGVMSPSTWTPQTIVAEYVHTQAVRQAEKRKMEPLLHPMNVTISNNPDFEYFNPWLVEAEKSFIFGSTEKWKLQQHDGYSENVRMLIINEVELFDYIKCDKIAHVCTKKDMADFYYNKFFTSAAAILESAVTTEASFVFFWWHRMTDTGSPADELLVTAEIAMADLQRVMVDCLRQFVKTVTGAVLRAVTFLYNIVWNLFLWVPQEVWRMSLPCGMVRT